MAVNIKIAFFWDVTLVLVGRSAVCRNLLFPSSGWKSPFTPKMEVGVCTKT
jgi:hypothetical protein